MAANLKIPDYPKKPHSTGQARITVAGESKYLGKFGSPESYRKYAQLVAQLADSSAPSPALRRRDKLVTLKELYDAYYKHATTYYVKRGELTSHTNRIRQSFADALSLYAATPAREFDQDTLKAARSSMVRRGLSRVTVNCYIQSLVQAFAWAAEHKLVPPETVAALKTVKPIQKGRNTNVKEGEGVEPANEADVLAALPKMNPVIAAMVRLQLATGMRPQEATSIRACDISEKAGGHVYTVTDDWNKTAHKGQIRIVPLNSQAMAILAPFVERHPEGFLFRPEDACPHLAGKVNDKYSTRTYGNAIIRACDRAGVEPFAPNQLRHLTATKIREFFNAEMGDMAGLEAAQFVLGHGDPSTTQIYAARRAKQTVGVMERFGAEAK